MKRNFAFVILLLIILWGGLSCQSKEKNIELYGVKAVGIGNIIVNMASACISQSRSYVTAWEYARVSGMDYDTAAAEMLGPEAERLKNQLRENKAELDVLMEELKDPPVEFAESYAKLLELYDLYALIHELALNPSQPMEDYNDSINSLQNSIAQVKDELDSMLVK